MQTPSTGWKEVIDPGEAERHAGYARIFTDIQNRKSQKFGTGRTLHRKQLLGARGTLTVAADLPEFARQGLFAAPGRFEARVRLSNGGFDVAPDKVPDIRGFALRVGGISGPSALGEGMTDHQDFLLINQEAFAFPKSGEFIDFAEAASRGNGALLGFLYRRYGLFGLFGRVRTLAKTMGRPFGGFAVEPLHSAVPIACGPYAVRVRLAPDVGNGAADPEAKSGWGTDFSKRLAARDLAWDLQLQPYVDEATTPIEDASVDWPTAYTTVARLVLPRQDTTAAEGLALAKELEAGTFDPWQGLAAHRPLGEVQRARRVVYYESQKGRGAN